MEAIWALQEQLRYETLREEVELYDQETTYFSEAASAQTSVPSVFSQVVARKKTADYAPPHFPIQNPIELQEQFGREKFLDWERVFSGSSASNLIHAKPDTLGCRYDWNLSTKKDYEKALRAEKQKKAEQSEAYQWFLSKQGELEGLYEEPTPPKRKSEHCKIRTLSASGKVGLVLSISAEVATAARAQVYAHALRKLKHTSMIRAVESGLEPRRSVLPEKKGVKPKLVVDNELTRGEDTTIILRKLTPAHHAI
jgi:hypothetical protein